MRTTALDILDDLRSRRLLPVALVLLIALVAVPVLLSEPAEEFTPPAKPTAGAAGVAGLPSPQAALDGKPLVSLAVLDDPSNLEVFEPKDPFRPLPSLDGDGGGLGGVVDTSSGTGGSAPTSSPTASTASGPTAAGTTGTTASPATTAPPATTGGGTTVKETLYTYTVDLEIGTTGNEKTRRSVDRLALLPSEDNPLLVFLGVTDDRKRALFLVDSELSQAGEGSCKPSLETCTFLYLRTDQDRNEHFFTDEEGTEYTLRLLAVNKEVVKPARGSSSRSSRRARTGAAGARPAKAFRPFHFPLFVDAEG
jgi:hypothetical protein